MKRMKQHLHCVYGRACKCKSTGSADTNGSLIGFDGYGDFHGDDVVLLEMRGSVPHVVIWGDANKEDPTHIISLASAKTEPEGGES